MVNSSNFEEFIAKRCEEVSLQNETYQKINESILQAEIVLRSLVPQKALEKLREYEKLNLELTAYAQSLFYRQALIDFK